MNAQHRLSCAQRAHAPFGRAGAQPAQQRWRCLQARAAQAGSDSRIENLPDICDDFQCNSSPQVEQHIRSFAKDIERHSRWTVTLFAPEVQFREKGTYSFKGRERYRSNTWNQDTMSGYITKVTNMQMRDYQTAQIQWSWQGQLAMFALSATVTSTLSMNQLTGKVLDHEDDVRLQGNPLGQLLYRVRKRLWATKQGASAVSSRISESLDNLTSGDDDTSITPDPIDANKFYQQQDNSFNEMLQYAVFLALLWTLWTAYTNLEGF